MVLGTPGGAGARARTPARQAQPQRSPSPAAQEAVIWHDLECASYQADLPLWRELAAAAQGEVLDIGAGSGRVTLDLARAGHRVTALERERALLAALAERAQGLAVSTACADARSFALAQRELGLCVVPMQTIQLLGGGAGRSACLRRIAAHLRPGSLVACAILAEVEPFDCAQGDPAPRPDRAQVDGRVYVSQPTRVARVAEGVLIERERRVLAATQAPSAGPERPPAALRRERHAITLDALSARQLQREGRAAGLRPAGVREIEATADHVGSTVVMLRG